MAISKATGDLTVKCGCEEVVSAWARGKDFCCSSARKGADIWRALRGELARTEWSVSLVWVKAHTSEEDVLADRISMQDHVLNSHCDTYAKLGAVWANSLSPTDDIVAEYDLYLAFYDYMGQFCWIGRRTTTKPNRRSTSLEKARSR